MPNMVTRQLDHVLLIALGSKNPTDGEWDEALALSRAQLQKFGTTAKCGAVVFTDGGSPSSKQRQALRALYGETPPPMALVTDSLVARGAVAVFGLFWPSSNAVFAPGDWASALRHVGLPARDAEVAMQVRAMRTALGELRVAQPLLSSAP